MVNPLRANDVFIQELRILSVRTLDGLVRRLRVEVPLHGCLFELEHLLVSIRDTPLVRLASFSTLTLDKLELQSCLNLLGILFEEIFPSLSDLGYVVLRHICV